MGSLIAIDAFRGLRPGVADWNLEPSMATRAHNTHLHTTALEPWMAPSLLNIFPAIIYSIYLPPDMQGTVATPVLGPNYYSWTEAVDPGLGSGFNHVIRWDTTGQLPPAWYEVLTGTLSPLGIAAPQVALHVVRTALSPVVATDVCPDDRAYTYTWVDQFSVESQPAPPTYVPDATDGETYVLSGFGVPPATATACRVYRSSAVLQDGKQVQHELQTSFQLVAQISVPIATYTDSAFLRDLVWGTLMTAENGDIPAPFQQVVVTTSGHFIGFYQNQLWVSERNEPWNWPEKSRMELPDRIIGICVHEYTIMRFGTASSHSVCFIGTTGRPYRMSVGMAHAGDKSETLAEPAPNMEHYPLLQRETMVATPHGAIYVSTLGLILLTPAGEAHVVTEGMIDTDDWLTWAPNVGAWWRGRYVGCRAPSGPSYMWEISANPDKQPVAQGFVSVDMPATCLHSGRDGRLYYANSVNLMAFNESNTPLTYKWKSKRFSFPNRVAFGSLRLEAEFGLPVQVDLYRDNQLCYSTQVHHDLPMKLPVLAKGLTWSVQISGTTPVRSIRVGGSAADLAVDKTPTRENA